MFILYSQSIFLLTVANTARSIKRDRTPLDGHGISTPSASKGHNRPHLLIAVFLCLLKIQTLFKRVKSVLVGCIGHPYGWPFLCFGSLNPIQSASLRLRPTGSGFKLLSKGITAMTTRHPTGENRHTSHDRAIFKKIDVVKQAISRLDDDCDFKLSAQDRLNSIENAIKSHLKQHALTLISGFQYFIKKHEDYENSFVLLFFLSSLNELELLLNYPPITKQNILALSQVKEITKLSRSSIYDKVKNDNTFPKPFKYSNNGLTNYWLEDEIYQYINDSINASRQATNAALTPATIQTNPFIQKTLTALTKIANLTSNPAIHDNHSNALIALDRAFRESQQALNNTHDFKNALSSVKGESHV